MPIRADLKCFDVFELDIANRRLTKDGAPLALGSRYFDALVLLVDEAGDLVSKDRFMDEVWCGIPVTDEALTQCIRTLRRTLGDDAAHPRYIETVPKHGYRFLVQTDGKNPDNIADTVERSSGRLAAAATLAGTGAGALGGLFYGVLGSTGGGPTVLVLTALVAALGTLAGAGIGLGLAGTVAWRGRTDATAIGGAALGGLAVGALGSTLGRDGVSLLTGEDVRQVTGMTEGLLLGAAVGLSGWLVLTRMRSSWARVMAVPAGIGAFAGWLIHIVGGQLLGGSLATLQASLGGTRLGLEQVASLAGEPSFGETANLMTSAIEGAVFVSCVVIGLRLQRRG